MSAMLDEYGRLCIVIICASMFFWMFGDLVMDRNNEGSIAYWYNEDIVDCGVFESEDIGNRDLTHNIGGVQNVTYAPHFHPLNGIEDSRYAKDINGDGNFDYGYMDMYKITGDYFTYADAMKIFDPVDPDVRTGIWMDEEEEVPYTKDPVIIYTRYDVAITDKDEDGNPMENSRILYEDVPATDRYGNTHKPNGESYGTHSQIKYTPTFVGELKRKNPDGTEFKIKIDDYTKLGMPPRFKLTYRIEVGSKKAEFQTMFIKDNYVAR